MLTIKKRSPIAKYALLGSAGLAVAFFGVAGATSLYRPAPAPQTDFSHEQTASTPTVAVADSHKASHDTSAKPPQQTSVSADMAQQSTSTVTADTPPAPQQPVTPEQATPSAPQPQQPQPQQPVANPQTTAPESANDEGLLDSLLGSLLVCWLSISNYVASR